MAKEMERHLMSTDTAKRHVRGLLEEALDRLDSNPVGSVWRLLDATGILEGVYPHPHPTGRGYQIGNVHGKPTTQGEHADG